MGITDICRMHILITAATELEIRPLIDWCGKGGVPPGRHRVQWLITGVGLLATTHSLMAETAKNRPDLLIQAGIAGSFRSCRPGTVYQVAEDRIGDQGVWENHGFRSVFDLGFAAPEQAPYLGGALPNPYTRLRSLLPLESVRGASVNEITTCREKISWYKQHFDPVIESMEGAAFHYVCLLGGLPFLQLRAVSNEVGQRDKSQWNIPLAVGNLNEQLISLIKLLEPFDETDFRI